MKIHLKWKITVALVITGLALLLIFFSDTKEEGYVESVRSALIQIDAKAKDLESVDVNSGNDGLLKVYGEIIDIADNALSLKPPQAMEAFDLEFKAYMTATRDGYYHIREGTGTGDIAEISRGIAALSTLDSSFLNLIR